MRLIDADALRRRMYHEAFETNTDLQRWDSGCWIRYKMFEKAIDEMPTIEQHWIPCSERLPEIGKFVLVTYKWINVGIDVSLDRFMGDGWLLSGTVTAWMPLPEPYKEEES